GGGCATLRFGNAEAAPCRSAKRCRVPIPTKDPASQSFGAEQAFASAAPQAKLGTRWDARLSSLPGIAPHPERNATRNDQAVDWAWLGGNDSSLHAPASDVSQERCRANSSRVCPHCPRFGGGVIT